MKALPKKIIRLDDGAEFLLDESTQQYELWIPGEEISNFSLQYTYECLIEDKRNKGAFKVANGTEDLLAMKKKWINFMGGKM